MYRPLPQEGNVKPRSFRLVEDFGIINRYGLNSHGAEAVSERLQHFNQSQKALQQQPGMVGVNLAKNTTSTNAKVKEIYIFFLNKI